MNIRLFFIFLFLSIPLLSNSFLLAQNRIIVGKVKDDKGKPLQGVEVTINDSISLTTNAKGEFNTLALKGAKPQKVRALKKGYKVKKWDLVGDEIQILLYSSNNFLTGKLLGNQGQVVRNIAVSLAGVSEVSPVFTNNNGEFTMDLPPQIEPNENLKFDVEGVIIGKEGYTYDKSRDYYIIKSTITHSGSESSRVEDKSTPQLFSVTVLFQEDYSPVGNLKIKVEEKEYQTDKEGRFQVVTSDVHVNKFKIDGFEISKFNVDANGNYVFLVIRTKDSEEANKKEIIPAQVKLDSLILDYRADFKRVINELEFKKQFLMEKSTVIRGEMESIAQKLRNEKEISPDQRSALKVYLRNLEDALIENDSTFEALQDQSNKVVEELRKIILEQSERIKKEDEKRHILEIELYLAIIAGIILLGLVVGFYFLSKRLRKQKEEIQHAYENIKNISSIGQKVTSTLDFRTMVQTANSNMASLIHSSFFGVGIYDEAEGRIEFLDFVKGEAQQDHFEYMDEEDKLGVWCVKNNKPVTINNLEMQYRNYFKKPIKIDENTPKSMIYLPLTFEDRILGVITAQSLEKNAFNDIDLKMMQTLASYVSVALSNANAYDVIKSKNKNITDSIRYAQTIQEAVMPSDNQMRAFFDDYFVIYRAKDIVSGDIYWLGHNPIITDGRTWTSFALIDCTGHGVPGGFMSVIASYLLSEVETSLVSLSKRGTDDTIYYKPALVLEQLDTRFREALKQYEKMNDDGMDVAFCTIEKLLDGQTKIVFAGAKRPLLYYRQEEGKLEIIKGEKRSIGGQYKKEHPFQNHEIILNKGDMIFLTTDGFADQNDTERHRFTSSKLSEIIEANASLSTKEQKQKLEEILDMHMKDVEQRDDITIIGIKM